MRRVILKALIAAVLLLITSCYGMASVPPMINYQGRLMQPSGAPVPDGTYSITFTIYDSPVGGNTRWTEENTAVQVKGGLFATMLGSVVNLPANLFDSPSRFFGVKVGDDPEMMPRQQIASVGFAVKAGSADVATTVLDETITTDKLVDKVVTASKLADSAVESANIQDGAVTPIKLSGFEKVCLNGAFDFADGSSDLAIPSGPGRIVGWNNVLLDTDGMFSTSTRDRIIVQHSGTYFVAVQIAFTYHPANGVRWLRVIRNGNMSDVLIVREIEASSMLDTVFGGAAITQLSAGDYLSVVIHQHAGSDLPLDAKPAYSHFEAALLP